VGDPPATGNSETCRFDRELGCTHAEFFRMLAAALAHRRHTVTDGRVVVAEGRRCVEIRLGPEGERRLGLLRLPVTRVEFVFDGYARSEIEAFMRRFDLAFQRGGG
jgi:hypothetical protein